MKRLVWLPLAGFLLIGGATVAAAAPSILTISPSAEAITNDDLGLRGGALLEEVLGDLVEQEVISQEQSDAVVAALEAKVEEHRADMAARVEQMRETWQQVQTFLEDEVVTQDEINQLPEDSPLREVFNSIADDGQVTLEQLRQLGPRLGRGFAPGEGFGPGHGFGHGRGFWLDDDTGSESGSE